MVLSAARPPQLHPEGLGAGHLRRRELCPGPRQVVVRLQVQPEFRRGPEDPRQQQRGLAAEAAAVPSKTRQPAVGEPRCMRQPRPADAVRAKKIRLEDLARMDWIDGALGACHGTFAIVEGAVLA